MSSLPLPPQLGNAIPGREGGFVGGQMQGTLPYKPSAVGGVAQGVASFLQNYNAAREADEKKAMDKAMQGLQLLQQGLPVDTREIAKNFQKAGVKLQTEGPTPEQVQAQQQKDQAQQFLLSGGAASGPVAPSVAGAAALQMANQPLPQGPPQKPQGMMGRIAQGLGFSQPQIQPNAPIMQSLADVGKMGQQQLQYKATLQAMTMGALNGDEKSQEMLRTMGMLPKLDKYEYLYKFGKDMGKTPQEVASMIWQTEMAPYTNVLLDFQAQMARIGYEQQKQSWGEVLDLAKQYPFVPLDQIQQTVAAKYSGTDQGRELYYKGMQQLSKTPRADAMEEIRKNRKDVREEKQLGLEARRTAATEAQVGIAGERLNLDKAEFDFKRQQEVRFTAEKAFDDVANVLSNKQLRGQLDQGSLNALTKKLVDEYNGRRQAGMPALTVEEITHWYWPWGTPEVQVRIPPAMSGGGAGGTKEGGMSKFVGTPPSSSVSNSTQFDPAQAGILYNPDPWAHMQ